MDQKEWAELLTAHAKLQKEFQDKNEQLELAIRGSQDGMWDWMLDTNALFLSSRWKEQLGYQEDELPNSFGTFVQCLVEEDRDKTLDYVQRYLDGKEKNFQLDFRMRHKNGSVVWIESRGEAFRREDGTPYRMAGSHTDITLRKQVEQELADARKMAEEANSMKSQFLANMSHEIRTPMNGILGFLDLLTESGLSESQAGYARAAKTASDSLLSLINDILDFSRIEAGKVQLETTSFDLCSLVEDVAQLMAPGAFEKRLDLHTLIGAEIPATVQGDPARIRQILTNLIGNAIKFTKAGDITVTLSGERQEDLLLISMEVRDTGIGMDPETLGRLFQPFVQGDASTTRKYGGSGLGLAICRDLARLMHGDILVQSEMGKGSTFTATIPLAFGSVSTDTVAPNPAALSGKRMMVIDDNGRNRMILRTYLEKAGCEVAEAESAETATSFLLAAHQQETLPDAVVVDFELPGIDGPQFAELLGKMSLPPLKLVLLSSMGRRGDALLAKRHGFAAYLSKPVRRKELLDCLAIILGEESRNGIHKETTIVTRYTAAEATRRGRQRILVVEDNEINQKVMEAMLKNQQLTCEMAGNGEEALDALRHKTYDLIFMDCQMPVMDGYHCTEAIRVEEGRTGGPRVPIIAITANAQLEDREKCVASGMDDYLAKPVQMGRLKQLLETYLSDRHE